MIGPNSANVDQSRFSRYPQDYLHTQQYPSLPNKTGNHTDKRSEERAEVPSMYRHLLIAAIDTGNWKLTEMALEELRQQYDLLDEENGENTLRTALLTGESTIFEYICEKGKIEISHGVACRDNYLKIMPSGEELVECRKKLATALERAAGNETIISQTQLLCASHDLQLSKDMHTLASQYYRVRHHYFLFLPATILTSVSAVLAFMSTSEYLARYQSVFILIAGIVATVTTLLQTISDQMGLNSKANMHRTAAAELEPLLIALNFNEVDAIKKGSHAFTEYELNVVRKQVLSVEASCTDSIPMFIEAVYNPLMEEFSYLAERAVRGCEVTEAQMLLMKIRLIKFISSEITNSLSWPWSVSTTRIAKTVRKKMRSIYMAIAESGEKDNPSSTSMYHAMRSHFSKSYPKILPKDTLEVEGPEEDTSCSEDRSVSHGDSTEMSKADIDKESEGEYSDSELRRKYDERALRLGYYESESRRQYDDEESMRKYDERESRGKYDDRRH